MVFENPDDQTSLSAGGSNSTLNSRGSDGKGGENFELNLATGEKVAVRQIGDKKSDEVLIFLNGIDRDMSEWDRVVAQLRTNKREISLVQIDLIGQGATTHALDNSTDTISYERQLSVLKELMNQMRMQGRRVTLVGHSYGGGIATKFAAEHPGLVERVVLIAPFVDRLEEFQPGVGPLMAWTRTYFDMIGQPNLYKNFVRSGSETMMTATWPMYRTLKGGSAKLKNVIALTRGIESLGMTQAISRLQTTRVDLLLATHDEVVPAFAHNLLRSNIPVGLRGKYQALWSTHEVVDTQAGKVTEFIESGMGR